MSGDTGIYSAYRGLDPELFEALKYCYDIELQIEDMEDLEDDLSMF